MNIYVGNLPYSAREEDLRTLFEAHGAVDSARIIMDKMTGKSKGFGFIVMTDDSEGHSAIEMLNNYQLDGRSLRVSEAREREERSDRGGNGGGDRPRRFNNKPRFDRY
jgi:RNA recognition motif-containing protein